MQQQVFIPGCRAICAEEGRDLAYYDHNRGKYMAWDCACVVDGQAAINPRSSLFGPTTYPLGAGLAFRAAARATAPRRR